MQDAVYREAENANMRAYGYELFLQKNDRVGQTARAQMHEAAEFLYIVRGRYRVWADGVPYEADEGDLLLFRSGVVHRIDMTGGAPGAYYVLKLHPSLIFSAFAGAGGEPFTLFLLTNPPGAPCLFSKAELAARGLDVGFLQAGAARPQGGEVFARRLSALSFVCALVESEGRRAEGPYPTERVVAGIQEIIRYLGQNWSSPVTAEQCARLIHSSYSGFARDFKAVTGKTFKQYLIALRLHAARNLLLTGGMSVTEVGALCGYENTPYFIQEYKRFHGVTPGKQRATV